MTAATAAVPLPGWPVVPCPGLACLACRIEVIEVRYEAGAFGRGFKPEPKSPASVRVVPMCEHVRQAVLR